MKVTTVNSVSVFIIFLKSYPSDVEQHQSYYGFIYGTSNSSTDLQWRCFLRFRIQDILRLHVHPFSFYFTLHKWVLIYTLQLPTFFFYYFIFAREANWIKQNLCKQLRILNYYTYYEYIFFKYTCFLIPYI